MTTKESFAAFSAIQSEIDAIDRQRSPLEAKAATAAVRFVHDRLVELGLDQTPVDSEHGNKPSYAMLPDGVLQSDQDDEDLDWAVGWLPRDVISNPTPPSLIYEKGKPVREGPRGWNPVVTVADLAAYLAREEAQ